MRHWNLSFILALFCCSGSLQANEIGNIYLTGEVGYTVMPIIGNGFSFGTAVDSNSALEFTYSNGEKDVEYAIMKAEYFAIKYKKFWGSSFYSNTGFAFKNVADETTDSVSPVFTAERRGRSFGIDASIGNRWDVDNLTIGVDWLGIYQPVSYNETRAFILNIPRGVGLKGDGHGRREGSHGHGGKRPSMALAGGSYDQHNNDWNRLAKYATVQALKIYVGLKF